jgi:hypothetical protein
VLKNFSRVKGAGIFGDRIHVLLDEGGKAKGDMESLLKESGNEILSLRKIPPTLEDVFIATVPEEK